MLSELANASQSDEPSDSSDYSNASFKRSNRPDGRYNAKQSDEKTLLTSLQDLEANDLSLHLFSTYHLKRSLCSLKDGVEQRQNKIKRVSDQEFLAKRWSVWPLFSDSVPRQHETFGRSLMPETQDHETFTRSSSGEHSRTVLLELLEAEASKRARGKYLSRSWETPLDHSDRPVIESEDSAHAQLDSEMPHLLSMPLSDDGKATQLLRPSMQRILRHLDDLLIGLHKARITSNRFQNQQRDVTKDSKMGDGGPHSELKHKKRPRRHLSLLPRDWSEVLGVASMTGWRSDTINRANDRCSVLFGEQMDFRTLSECPELEVSVFSSKNPHTITTKSPSPVRLSHEIESSWQCPNMMPPCHEVFWSLADLKTHTLQQHSESFAYADFRHLESSPRTHHALEHFTCPDPTCSAYFMVFESRSLLREHVREFHREIFSLAPRLLASQHTYFPGSSNEMRGGVHLDGFLERVPLFLDTSEILDEDAEGPLRHAQRDSNVVEASAS